MPVGGSQVQLLGDSHQAGEEKQKQQEQLSSTSSDAHLASDLASSTGTGTTAPQPVSGATPHPAEKSSVTCTSTQNSGSLSDNSDNSSIIRDLDSSFTSYSVASGNFDHSFSKEPYYYPSSAPLGSGSELSAQNFRRTVGVTMAGADIQGSLGNGNVGSKVIGSTAPIGQHHRISSSLFDAFPPATNGAASSHHNAAHPAQPNDKSALDDLASQLAQTSLSNGQKHNPNPAVPAMWPRRSGVVKFFNSTKGQSAAITLYD